MSSDKITDAQVSDAAPDMAQTGSVNNIEMQARLYQLWQNLGMAVVIIVLCVFMAIFAPHFPTFRNLINVTRQVSINAILAAGMTFVILTGGIDLSVGS